jgi:hypothetical protein
MMPRPTKLAFATLAFWALLMPVLIGCNGAPDSGDVGQRPFTAAARFIPGDDVMAIQVSVNDRLPLREAELVGPDGAVIAAASVDVASASAYRQPFSEQSFAGGPGSNPAAVALPLGGLGNIAPPGSQTVTVDQFRSTALIRLDDPGSYARDWRLWQVRLRLGDPPHITTLTLPAPQPPPSL